MTSVDVASAIALVFILGMIWLRTRMQYRQRRRKLQLRKAGRIYFASALALLAVGWFAAPLIGLTFWPQSGGANPAMTRVIWFLLTYYVFIAVHRYLEMRGVAIFRVLADADSPAPLP